MVHSSCRQENYYYSNHWTVVNLHHNIEGRSHECEYKMFSNHIYIYYIYVYYIYVHCTVQCLLFQNTGSGGGQRLLRGVLLHKVRVSVKLYGNLERMYGTNRNRKYTKLTHYVCRSPPKKLFSNFSITFIQRCTVGI